MNESWTISELTVEAARRIAALPVPQNGQVRAVPDERTIRYYGTIGLLDRPLGMRGRTALYGPRHLAQVVAIKRLQTTGRSLAEIQELWSTLDDATLSQMSGVQVGGKAPSSRREFWKHAPAPAPAAPAPVSARAPVARRANRPTPATTHAPVELRIELAEGVSLVLAVPDGISLSPADVDAMRAAAAPLVELARRPLGSHSEGEPR